MVVTLARLSSILVLVSLGETACRDVLLCRPRGLQYAAAISMSWLKFCKHVHSSLKLQPVA